MRKFILLFVALFFIASCNDDDSIPVDYSKHITTSMGTLGNQYTDVLRFRMQFTNTSDKDITVEVRYDIYRKHLFFGDRTTNYIVVKKNSLTRYQEDFSFAYIWNDIYTVKNVKFRVVSVEK